VKIKLFPVRTNRGFDTEVTEPEARVRVGQFSEPGPTPTHSNGSYLIQGVASYKEL
jgi:hypothetical protein